MNFDTLHENLRLEILRRIDRGTLSGSTLARATGFQQAHISNFLNRKRLLSLAGLDRVLAAQSLSVLDLLPAASLPVLPSRDQPTSSLTQPVAVVTHTAAVSSARIQPSEILETIEVPDAILHLSRDRPASGRASWQRFVAVRVDAQQAAAMDPILRYNSVAVLDRHYNSLATYRSQQPTLYAVHTSGALHLCFLEFDANQLILRPRNEHFPVRLIGLSPNELPADRIIGRVCYVLAEY